MKEQTQKPSQKVANGPQEKQECNSQTSLFLKISICMTYAASSFGITFVNKKIYQAYNFSSPLNLLFVQCIFNLGTCTLLTFYRSFVNDKAFNQLLPYSIVIPTFKQLKTKFAVGFFLGALVITQVLFGLFSIKLINIPFFLAFRRTMLSNTVIIQFFVQGIYPTRSLLLATALVCTGAFIGGWENLNADAFGYLLILGNNFAQSFQNVATAKFNQDKSVTAFDVNIFMALIGLPLSFFIINYNGEILKLYDAFFIPEKRDLGLVFMICLSGSFGIMIQMSSLLTVALCGPVAICIVGLFKDVGLTVAGFLFFTDTNASQMMIIGLFVSFVGGVYYAHGEYQKVYGKQQDKKNN